MAARGAPPELRPTAARLYARMHAWFADAIAAGIEAGEFRADADPDRTADRVLAMCDGFGVRALLTELSLDRARAEVWAFLAQELGLDPRMPQARSRVEPRRRGGGRRHGRRLGGLVRQPDRRPRDSARAPQAGQGASSRAAGIVRAQGGTPTAVALGRWTIDFYERQRSMIGTDSGFRRLGYLLLARTDAEASEAKARVAMQQAEGLEVRWVEPEEAVALNPTLAPRRVRGRDLLRDRGLHRPAAQRARLRARAPAGRGGAARALRVRGAACGGRARGGRASGRRDDRLLARDPHGRALAARDRPPARLHVFAGGARHQVAVTSPHEAFAGEPLPMVFDVGAGIYWRQEEDGLLFGWSDPDERPGEAREVSSSTWSGSAPGLPKTCPSRRVSACARCGRRRSTTRPTTCRSSPRRSRA